MKTKIIFISIIFVLSVFLSFEKASADSCGSGGTCVSGLCPLGTTWNNGKDDGQCNMSGGTSERCCTPSTREDACCSAPAPASAAYFCSTGFKKDSSGICDVTGRRCCIADGTGGGTACMKKGDICTDKSLCCSGLNCVSDDGGSYICEENGKLPVAQPGGGGSTPAPGASGGGWKLSNYSKFGLPESSIMGIVSGILGWLLGILGLFGVIGFIIAGIIYLMSTGDEDMIERAKAAMKWSIVGVVVGLLGVVIIQAVSLMLTGSSMF